MYLSLLLVLASLQYICSENYYDPNINGSCTNCADRSPLIILPVVIKLFRYPKLIEDLQPRGANKEQMKDVDILQAQRNMTTWPLAILLQLNVIKTSMQSIAGVTYMDHFDFEQRYRDVYECDPFYWHPLHLPEHCAEMYEKLIHSKIATRTPVRVVKERADVVYKLYNPFTITAEIAAPDFNYYRDLTPYEKMFAYLKRDITKRPKAPTIELMPHFGPVAVYRQPISRRSEVMIKKIAEAYANAQPHANNGEFYGNIDVRSRNKGGNDTIHKITTAAKNKPIKITKELKNGHIVTLKNN